MICKEIPKTMYCHIGGSGTWGCEFPEDLNMEGITLLKRDMEFETPFGVTACMKLYEMDASITADHKPRQVLYVDVYKRQLQFFPLMDHSPLDSRQTHAGQGVDVVADKVHLHLSLIHISPSSPIMKVGTAPSFMASRTPVCRSTQLRSRVAGCCSGPASKSTVFTSLRAALGENPVSRSCSVSSTTCLPVSYTHLDVYKRQGRGLYSLPPLFYTIFHHSQPKTCLLYTSDSILLIQSATGCLKNT